MDLSKYSAIFFDDLESNFKDSHLCKSVLPVLSPPGKHIEAHDAFWSKAPFRDLRDWESDGEEMFYQGAGISRNDIATYTEALKDGALPNIQLVAFDFDCTISTWNGLFGPSMAAWVSKWRRAGHWETVRDTLFGGKNRCREIAALLAMLSAQERCAVISNQGENTAIRTVLRELGYDFNLPALMKIPVFCLKERKNQRKFAYIRKMLGELVCG